MELTQAARGFIPIQQKRTACILLQSDKPGVIRVKD